MFKKAIEGKKGIFAMHPMDEIDFRATGHCDIFDGVICKKDCYFQDALEIFFWELPLN